MPEGSEPSHAETDGLEGDEGEGIERIKRELTEWDSERKTDPRRYCPITECAPCYKAIYGTVDDYEEQNPPKWVYYYR